MSRKNDILLVDFVSGLYELCRKHKLSLSGRMRVIKNTEEWDAKSFLISPKDIVDYGYARDMCGPFVECEVNKKPTASQFKAAKVNTAIVDKDILLKDGVKSPADCKTYGNRREWNDHLKRNGCVEIGNDYNNHTPKPNNADHNVRGDLINAMKEKGVL